MLGFFCDHNLLTTLPLIPDTIFRFDCSNNPLTSLTNLPVWLYYINFANTPNLHCLPLIKQVVGPASYCFNMSGSGVKCFPNVILHDGYNPGIDTIPVCDLNNPGGCQVAWNIQGTIYNDANSDCIQQDAEAKVYPIKVNLYQSGDLLQSAFFEGGNYSFKTGLGNYQVKVATDDLPFEFTCPGSGDTTVGVLVGDSLRYNVNFGIKSKPGYDIGIRSVMARFRPAMLTTVLLSAGDMGRSHNVVSAAGISGKVTVTLSGPVHYNAPVNGALTPTSVFGNVITWDVADFSAVDMNKDFYFTVLTDTNAAPSSRVCVSVSVTPFSADIVPANNTFYECFSVTNSHDPNEKEVNPIGNVDTGQQWMTYTVHFQNTGTDTAYSVYVLDTLDSHLDASSFRLLTYSYPAIAQLFLKPTTVVKFSFPGINLVDSVANEPGSHGYVQYQVKLKPNLSLGTPVKNSASIYFDLNAPVRTNTVTSTMCINSYNHISAGICQSETYLFNGQHLRTGGDYTLLVPNAIGCDSLITLHLTVQQQGGDSITVLPGGALTVSTNAGVQWLNCNTGQLESGGAGNTFTPSHNGTYAAIIPNGNCTDTTDCVTTTLTGIAAVVDEGFVSIYPNPSVNGWQLTVDGKYIGSQMEIYDANGRVVFTSEIRNLKSEIAPRISAGVYWLHIVNADRSVVRKLVKM